MQHHEKIEPPHVVYRMFAADGTLLYVGCSLHPCSRIASHGADKTWLQRVTNITLKWYPNWLEGVREEYGAIRTEKPMYNKHSPNPANAGMRLREPKELKPRQDGLHCPGVDKAGCGKLKRKRKVGYCKECYAEYRRRYRDRKRQTLPGWYPGCSG